MATRTGLGYAAAGIVVAGSIIVATAATVGLRTQQASEAPAPSTIESALVTNTAPAPVAPAGVVTNAAAVTAGGAPQSVAQPFAAAQPLTQPVAAQPLSQPAAARWHDDDDDEDEDEHEERRERESSRNVFTTFRREHR